MMKTRIWIVICSILCCLAASFAQVLHAKSQSEVAVILVELKGGRFVPELISARANKPITIQFIRRDRSLCSEMVRFPTLNIMQALVHNQPTNVILPPLKMGTYPFTCKGNLYQGSLSVF